jgi:hypothetical protein
MRHVPDGVLRRLLEEPLAVPDSARRHREACGRCRSNSAVVASDAATVSRLLSAPQPDVDAGRAWAQMQRRLADPVLAQHPPIRIPRRPGWRVLNASVSTGAAVTAGLALTGVAAAATLTTVFAPTHVRTVPVNTGDLRAVVSLLGAGVAPARGGLLPATGSQQLPFGTLHWTSAGHGRQVSSIADASALTHLAFTAPATLPAGVGPISAIYAQPMVTATVLISRNASPSVSGTSLTVTGGPAMLVQYGGQAGGTSLTTLGILTMRRPVATSTGATTTQLENFVLARPGIPADLVRQIKLLGNLTSVLPVPVPPGAASQQVRIGARPGVLITAESGAASAVIWESHDGLVHVAAGLLDGKDILNVARQLG